MNSTPILRPRPLALAVAVAVGSMPASSLAAAGRIQFAWGQVSVEQAGGSSEPLKRGDKIDAGDTIVTERGRAQIKFTDGSYVSLQPKTTFKVEEYNDGKDGGEERSFMSLFRGGLRAVSGAIGRTNRNSYRLNTPVGTIGIRGTEYLVMLDDSGAIITVGDGAIALINDAGEVTLVNGQTGRIVDRSSLPKIVDRKAVVPPPAKDVRDAPDADEAEQDDDEFQVSVTGDNGNPDDVLDRIVDGGVPDDGDVGEPPPPVVEPPAKLVSGPGFAVAAAFWDGNNFQPRNDVEHPVTTTFAEGQLTGWDGSEGGGSNRGQLSLIEAGSDAYIGWGRWVNPDNTNRSFTRNDQNEVFVDGGESLHYVAGRPTDLVALASAGETMARYSVLSYTTPTDRHGNTGAFLGATFGVDIANQEVSGSLAARMAMIDYNLEFYGLNANNGVFQASANVVNSPNGGCFSSGCDGYVAGLVSGPQADRAGFTVHIRDFDNNRDIFDAVTFTRNPNGPLPPTPDL